MHRVELTQRVQRSIGRLDKPLQKIFREKIAPGIIRPIIPIELIHKDISVPYEVLVDSGADFCIFDAEIADIINLSIWSLLPFNNDYCHWSLAWLIPSLT